MDHIQETVFETHDPNAPPSNEPIEVVQGNTVIKKFPDGSAVVEELPPQGEKSFQDPNNHDENLAATLPSHIVKLLGYSLCDAIEEDVESQEDYLESIADVIKYLGIMPPQTNESEDLPFKGASTIYSMALFESALDLLASAMASLLPSNSIVDCVINGEASDEIKDRAYRKKTYFNYYLSRVAVEFKKEHKRALFWAIITGSCYKKVYIDPILGRPTSMYISPEDFIVNREFSTHLAASRKTHILHMDEREVEIRKKEGIYVDEKVFTIDTQGEESVVKEQLNEIAGYSPTYNTKDNSYKIYECHVDYRIKEDILAPEFDLPLPYIISIDAESKKILRIQRNWESGDFLKKKKEYFVNYSMLPSLDGEGYGLMHYGGRQAEAATSITRQLINAGTYANFPGGVYMSGIRLENNNLRPAPGEFVPVQTGGLPVGQAIEALPYKEPSPALSGLLEKIEDGIRKPSAIINQKVAEMTPRAPMGSVLAMLESLQKVPNAILQGFHESFQHELMLFNERFAEWMPEGGHYPFKVPEGEMAIMRNDFLDNIVVIPASDPALQNSTYRFMQSEIILNQARQNADIHNLRYAYEYFYKNMGLSPEDIQNLLPKPKEAEETIPLDPITENQNLMTGKPAKAGIAQDHDAHELVHSLISSDPNATPEIKAAAQAHIQEHKALKFLVDMQAQIGFEMPEDSAKIPVEQQNKIAVAAAEVAKQQLEQMQQEQAANQPQQPIDPAIVMMEEVKQRAQQAQAKHEVDMLKLEIEREKLMAEQEKTQAQFEEKQRELQAKLEVEQLKAELENKDIELNHVIKEKDLALKEIKELQQRVDNPELLSSQNQL